MDDEDHVYQQRLLILVGDDQVYGQRIDSIVQYLQSIVKQRMDVDRQKYLFIYDV